MRNEKYKMNAMDTWLSEYSNPRTRNNNRRNFLKFLAWSSKTPQDLVKQFDKNKTRTLVLQYQNYLMNIEKKRPNSVRTLVNSVRAFYSSQCETLKLKGKIVKQTLPIGEHTFSLEDLKAMHAVANTEDKAILSLACSLGWHAGMFLSLDRKFIEDKIKRAKSQNEDFARFDHQRKKTGSPICGILTPIAMFDLERHLAKNKPQDKLFNIDADTLNRRVRNLVSEANILTTGSVSFKLFRKWLMDSLDEAGLSAFQQKIVVGKAVPATDLTYLQNLKKRAFRNYKKAYPIHLSLTQNVNGSAKYNILVDLVTRHVKAQSELIEYMKSKGRFATFSEMPAQLLEEMREVREMASIMRKKNGEKPHEENNIETEKEA